MTKNFDLKNLLKAAALAAEAGSRGSAGNIASTIVGTDLDFSKSGCKQKKGEGVPKQTKKINAFDAYNTDLAAGSELTDKKIYGRQKNVDMPQ